MKEDVLLRELFNPKRWEEGFIKAIDKRISLKLLYTLSDPAFRVKLKRLIEGGKYDIAPPHISLIPKKGAPGEFRKVYVNEGLDRILLSMINDVLFELTPDMIHKNCRSYLKGVSCGSVVQAVAKNIRHSKNEVLGFKTDLSKYFDSVPLKLVDEAFDMVENRCGKSAVVDVLRKYYHSGLYFDEHNNLADAFDERECGQSLKQGCAVAAWLANVILYDVDKKMSSLPGIYYRYSDDMFAFTPEPEKGLEILRSELAAKGIAVNEKKTVYLKRGEWFELLGFAMKGKQISIAKPILASFRKKIEDKTINNEKATLKSATHAVNNYLYRGNGQYSWADRILAICNVKEDIRELDKFVMDCLRAVATGKKRVGGLGFAIKDNSGCVVRGTGRNVTENRKKMPVVEGYLTLGTMYNARRYNRALYKTLVNTACL